MLPAWFASGPCRVNLVYLMAPDLVFTAHAFVQQIARRIRSDSVLARLFAKRSALLPSSILPPVTCEDYERVIEDAVDLCQRTSTCRMVLIGPGGFNEDAADTIGQSPDLCSSINEMILRVGERHGLPVINAFEVLAEEGGSVFLPRDYRWSAHGHHVVAREIESVLSSWVRDLTATIS